jgi:hypothetical protein
MAGKLISALKEKITDALPGFVKDALGIHSPSRVFMELGAFTAAGMALGIAGGARDVQRATDRMLPSVPRTSSFASPPVAARGLLGAAAAASAPQYLVLVDQDGDLIGRMQVEAGRVQDGAVTPLTLGRASW